jgi:hypothetical protein
LTGLWDGCAKKSENKLSSAILWRRAMTDRNDYGNYEFMGHAFFD